jgi:hypothetical protein
MFLVCLGNLLHRGSDGALAFHVSVVKLFPGSCTSRLSIDHAVCSTLPARRMITCLHRKQQTHAMPLLLEDDCQPDTFAYPHARHALLLDTQTYGRVAVHAAGLR